MRLSSNEAIEHTRVMKEATKHIRVTNGAIKTVWGAYNYGLFRALRCPHSFIGE